MNSQSIAILGCRGYVGSALVKAFSAERRFRVVGVNRDNYELHRKDSFDVVVNAAMPSKRFWAKENPLLDFKETVQKTADIFYGWRFRKFIQISTVSARTEPDSVYGRHKVAAEKICGTDAHLIVRLSAMYGSELTKGALMDILKGNPVFASGQSQYPFASVDFISAWIAKNLHRTGLVEVGARNSVSLEEIAEHLKMKVTFQGPVENQSLLASEPEFPDAKEVFTFMRERARSSRKVHENL